MRKMGGKRGKTKKGTYKKRINRKRANRRRTNRKQTGGTIINIDFLKYPATGQNLEEAQMINIPNIDKEVIIYATLEDGYKVHADQLGMINRQFSDIFNTFINNHGNKKLFEGHIWTVQGDFLGNRLKVQYATENRSKDVTNLPELNFYHTDVYGNNTSIRHIHGSYSEYRYPLIPNTKLYFYYVKGTEQLLQHVTITITYEKISPNDFFKKTPAYAQPYGVSM